MPLVLAYNLTSLYINSIALPFAEIATQIVVIVYLPKETDALRILSLGINKMILLRNTANGRAMP